MQHVTLQTNIAEVLGVTTLSQEEQESFLADIGDIMLETASVRLLSILDDAQQTALEAYLDSKPDGAVLLQHLLEHYKQFENILEEVVLEFKEDALAVMSRGK
jgi:hypothetical protein